MKKIGKAILIAMVLLLIFPGCWDRAELNNVTIVSGMVLQKGKEKKVRLAIEAINAKQIFQGEGEGAAPAVIYSMEGNTIAELVDKLNVAYIRKTVFSHLQTLVIDEDLAREGVGEFFQYLERNGEFRNDFKIIVARGVSATDIISTTYPIQPVPSFKITSQIETIQEEWGGDPRVRLTDFIQALTSQGRHPVATSMTITGHPNLGKDISNNEELQPSAIAVMDGMAVFKDDQLLGYLNVDDTRNYLWTQDIKLTTLSIPCEEDKFLGVRIKNSTSNVKTAYINGQPKITINLLLEVELQSSHCTEDLTAIETYQKYQKLINNTVSEKIKETISKVQDEYAVDIFGFGDTFYRQHPKTFHKIKDDWDAQFVKAEIVVNTNAYIRRAGIRTKGFMKDIQ